MKNKLIIIFLLLLPLLTPYGLVLDVSHPSSASPNVAGNAASEEETVDSFDVHPESGRWNTTLDDAIVDRVIDSQFEILTIQNETSDSSGYEMNRGTTKTDGRFEWRMKSDGSGNQTEYFRDKIGDESDFTEGDTEGWAGLSGGITTIANGILTITRLVSDATWGIRISVNISADIYHTLRLKIKGIGDTDFRWQSSQSGGLNINSGDVPSDWTILEHNLSAGSTWTGLATTFDILFATTTTSTIEIDFIQFVGNYDFATHLEGEVEDTWNWEVENSTQSWSGNVASLNVTNGVMTARANIGVDNFLRRNIDEVIKTDIFNTVVLNLNDSGDNLEFEIRGKSSDDSFTKLTPDWIDIGSGSVEHTINLTADADWISFPFYKYVYFAFRDADGSGLEGDETLDIDYFLILGEFNPSDSVIGLIDNDNNPLLNITTHFVANGSARFEFELLDATGEFAYHFNSDWFNDLSNQFIIGRVDFDVLKSELRVTITAENGSRINRAIFPQDFIIDSGLIPSLFSNAIPPRIFLSTSTNNHTWLQIFVDWIKGDYKEREWEHTVASLEADWLWSTPTGEYVQDDIAEELSQWKLTVPRLDAMSGTLQIVFEDQTEVVQNDDLSYNFYLIGVDGDDGGTHTICYIRVGHFVDAMTRNNFIQIYDGDDVLLWAATWDGIVTESVAADFSISLNEDRSEVAIKVRGYKDFKGSVYKDGIVNLTVASFVTDPSQEFIVSTLANIFAFAGDTEAALQVIGLDLLERDIFADIGNIIDDIIGVGQDVIGGGVDIFTALFRWVVSTITDFLGVMTDLLLGGLEALATLLDTVISTLDSVVSELQGLASDIATAVWSGIGNALDFITDAIANIIDDFIAGMNNLLDAVITQLLILAEDTADLLFAIVDFLLDLLLNVLDELWQLFEGVIFFIWDAIGLPDVLAFADLLLITIFDVMTAAPDILLDIMSWVELFAIFVLIIWWFWAFFLSFAEHDFNPFEGMSSFIEKCFTNLLPFSLLGFEIYVPQALAIIPLTVFLIFVDSGFNIW